MERCPDACSVRLSAAHLQSAARLGNTKQSSTKAHCGELSGLRLVLLLHPPPPPFSIKKASLLSLMCRHLSAAAAAAAGCDAPGFSLHSSPVSPPDIGRESTSTDALQSALKWFCHSGKNAQQPDTQLHNKFAVDMGVWRCGESQDVSLIVCALPWRVCIQLHFLFLI